MIETKNLTKKFDSFTAVDSLDLRIETGEFFGLLGPNGAGKTTTALSILRLVPDPPGVIKNGSITLDGKDILNLPQKDLESIRGNLVSMIFQDPIHAPGYEHGRDHGISGPSLFHATKRDQTEN